MPSINFSFGQILESHWARGEENPSELENWGGSKRSGGGGGLSGRRRIGGREESWSDVTLQ